MAHGILGYGPEFFHLLGVAGIFFFGEIGFDFNYGVEKEEIEDEDEDEEDS